MIKYFNNLQITLRSNQCTEVVQNFRKLIIYSLLLTQLYEMIYLPTEYELQCFFKTNHFYSCLNISNVRSTLAKVKLNISHPTCNPEPLKGAFYQTRKCVIASFGIVVKYLELFFF